MPIRFLDMFAGIGGFRSGLERLGGFKCIGSCEIDKYAKQAYDAIYPTKGKLYFADARTIDPYTLPDIDLICGGFPCQSFSIAGLRRGFQDDTRGTLFFEITRIAAVKRPPFLLLENVPGLLSHDKGRTFATILGALDELGYDVAWQILNSKDFGVPQSRKRVYIVGYLRERCAGEILSFTNANAASLIQLLGGTEGNRVYSDEGVGITLTSNARLRRKNRTLRCSTAYQGRHKIRLSARTSRRQHRPCLPDNEYTARPGRRKDRPYRNARQYAGLFFYRHERRRKAYRNGSVHYRPTGQRHQ